MTNNLLTSWQKAAYRSDGFLVLTEVIPIDELDRVRKIAARLLRRRAGADCGDLLDLAGTDEEKCARLPQLLMPVKYAPELAASALRQAAETIARQLIGEPIEYQGEHLIVKPARVGAKTPLHQDEAYWSPSTDYQSLSIWFPLQDVDERNGCMRFVAGSHHGGVLPHRSADLDLRHNSLELAAVSEFTSVSIPLRRGGATVHHCRTIHGAGPNRTTRARYAYIFGFGHPAKQATAPRSFPWQQERRLLREARARAAGYALTKMHPEH